MRAWCGTCGQWFDLAEAVAPGAAGRCPRCGVPFAPSYEALLVGALQSLLQARAAEDAALRQIHDLAPRLHVEGAQ